MKWSIGLVGILIMATLVRVGLLLYAEKNPQRFDYPDSHRYLRVARNISAGQGPVESVEVKSGTDPLFPSILAVAACGENTDDATLMCRGRIINCFLGLVAVAMLAYFARRLGGEPVGLIAAALLAFDPILLFFNGLVLTETPYIVLLLGACCCLTRAGRDRGWIWAGLAGLLLGLGTITRSTGLLLPLVWVPIVWQLAKLKFTGQPLISPQAIVGPARPPAPSSVRCSLMATTIFLMASWVALMPTVLRNYRLFGQFVPVRTGGGASLMEALGPWADGGPGMEKIVYPPFPPDANEVERDRLCRAAAWEWTRQHPAQALQLAFAKLQRTWSVTLHAPGYGSVSYKLMAWLSVGPELAFGLLGLWRVRRQGLIAGWLLTVPFYFTLVHMVFVGSVRYRAPAMPLVFVLTGIGMAYLWNLWTKNKPCPN